MWTKPVRRGRGLLVMSVLAATLLAGCAAGSTLPASSGPGPTASSPTSGRSGTPSGTPRATGMFGTVAVHGIEDCTILSASYLGNIDGEQFHCIERTSDPRVDGEWQAWIVTTETGGGLGWWTGTLVMTNDGGTWRGVGTGTTSGIPNRPVNLGEVVWTGEGGYAGLVYHELVHGSNGRLETAGWIESAG